MYHFCLELFFSEINSSNNLGLSLYFKDATIAEELFGDSLRTLECPIKRKFSISLMEFLLYLRFNVIFSFVLSPKILTILISPFSMPFEYSL